MQQSISYTCLDMHAEEPQVLIYCTLPQYRIVYCTNCSGPECQQCQSAARRRACEDISQGVSLALLMLSLSVHVLSCYAIP